METLYFDLLQFLYHLALAILVGGAIVLGTAAAPAIFASIRSRGEAGAVFGAVLGRYDGLAILCVFLIVVTSVLKATAFEVTGAPETRLVIRSLAPREIGERAVARARRKYLRERARSPREHHAAVTAEDDRAVAPVEDHSARRMMDRTRELDRRDRAAAQAHQHLRRVVGGHAH